MPDTDFDLVNGVYEQIGKKYGRGAHVTEFTDEERIVILVMLTTGIVANGGFQYLFEGEIQWRRELFTHIRGVSSDWVR